MLNKVLKDLKRQKHFNYNFEEMRFALALEIFLQAGHEREEREC